MVEWLPFISSIALYTRTLQTHMPQNANPFESAHKQNGQPLFHLKLPPPFIQDKTVPVEAGW